MQGSQALQIRADVLAGTVALGVRLCARACARVRWRGALACPCALSSPSPARLSSSSLSFYLDLTPPWFEAEGVAVVVAGDFNVCSRGTKDDGTLYRTLSSAMAPLRSAITAQAYLKWALNRALIFSATALLGSARTAQACSTSV